MTDRARQVLVLDPDPEFADRLKAALSSSGVHVDVVDGIDDAVDRIRDEDIDCLVMDEWLPEMRGSDAIPVIRAIDADVPVIITAARNSVELEARIRGAGVFFYHCKAFGMRDLVLAVGDAVRGGAGRRKETRHG